MYDKLVNCFESKSTVELIAPIQEFICLHKDVFSFPELNHNKQRERLWAGLFRLLDDHGLPDAQKLLCVSALKILIRDKTDLDTLITIERIDNLMKCAHLKKNVDEFPNETNTPRILESVKCLYNIIINFNPAAKMLYDCGVMDPLVKRVMNYNDSKELEIKQFDLKLLFLMTAFCKSTRIQLIQKVGGLSFFNSMLRSELGTLKNTKISKQSREQHQSILFDEFKILFNVLLEIKTGEPTTDFCHEELTNLVVILREYLITDTVIFGSNLISDLINLFTLIPIQHLNALTVMSERRPSMTKDLVDQSGLTAVSKIMDYLDQVLTDFEEGKNSNPHARELLPPVLLVLLHLAKSGSVIRKHIRKRVLPKLTEAEVFTRPEEGKTLRNKLCRLLTSPITNITDITADFLFVLCKETVGRMVKYTGYGNAAGLFARRGLMSRPLEYSSDSEGSDTEGYNKHKEFINPIIGCRAPAHPDPLEGMTEEQKEILAMELVNKIDKLMQYKVIQPCIVGSDGKHKSIEHVQQLQLSKQSSHNENESDDE